MRNFSVKPKTIFCAYVAEQFAVSRPVDLAHSRDEEQNDVGEVALTPEDHEPEPRWEPRGPRASVNRRLITA